MNSPVIPGRGPVPARSAAPLRAAGATAAAVVAAPAACASTPASAGAGRPEKPDVTVAVDPATSVAGLYIARQRGYFTAAGSHVTVVAVASGMTAPHDLAHGPVDIDEGPFAVTIGRKGQ